jgi:PBP1b-binding outer membrane lipoprotein LpoB
MQYAYLSVLLSAAVLSGCASSAVEDNFGKAVAQMRRAQTSNPATLTGSQDRPVEGIDPEGATMAIESMRKDTPDRAAVKRDILINVGTQQNGGGNQ